MVKLSLAQIITWNLNALIQALKAINTNKYPISVFSDSKYIIESINKGWYKGLERKGWVKGDGKEPLTWNYGKIRRSVE